MFNVLLTTGGGFHYSQKYQVSELIENNTMRVEKVHDGDVLSKIHCNNYIGLEDDGRLPNIPWREQNINTIGYHYYMTPETAQLGLDKLPNAIKNKPHQWEIKDWPDLTQMDVFNLNQNITDPYLQTR